MNKPKKCSVDMRTKASIDRIQLTCCSVQDLGLKEYAGVLVSNAGEEQPFGLHWSTRYYHLRDT